MLVYASNWTQDRPQYSLEQLQADPLDVTYVEGWMRDDDRGVVLEAEGQAVGAGWYRLVDSPDRIYGWAAADVPVLGIALDPEHRDRGLGRRLMRELMGVARELGYARISLGVENGNRRAKHLYESLGFTDVRTEGEDATVMVADLQPGKP
jgi:ribosomal protein S18 acetylase RimI-like enzyme